MTELSPAAQAVLKAACIHHGLFNEEIIQRRRMLAAALRAVADYAQRSSYAATPSTDWGDGWRSGVNDTARGLLAIATELDGAQ
jgi:hypothetical protein